MTLWIILTLMVSATMVLISVPLIRHFEKPVSKQSRAISVSRDQLAELDRDISRGLIAEAEAMAARTEIERRILTAAKAPAEMFSTISNRGRLVLVSLLLGWVVAGAMGIYLYVGRPDLPAKPFDVTALMPKTTLVETAIKPLATGQAPAGTVDDMIEKLEARLVETPDDAEGWRMLGWSYFSTERFEAAARAYGRAVSLDATDPDVLSAYGETLVRKDKGLVSEAAIAAFDQALAINPADARARFFKGMAQEQAGNSIAAIEAWLDILATAPAGADWVTGLQERVRELAAAVNFDLGDRLKTASIKNPANLTAKPLDLPKTEPGPTAAEVAAAKDLSEKDRQAMIEGMVDQLAERLISQPDDVDGWIKLIRSRLVLQDQPAAIAAYESARDAFKGSPEKSTLVEQAAKTLGLDTN